MGLAELAAEAAAPFGDLREVRARTRRFLDVLATAGVEAPADEQPPALDGWRDEHEAPPLRVGLLGVHLQESGLLGAQLLELEPRRAPARPGQVYQTFQGERLHQAAHIAILHRQPRAFGVPRSSHCAPSGRTVSSGRTIRLTYRRV